jgi:signal transduction histidine kinase
LKAANASSLAKTRFLETMSHELRTPLNTIIGYAELTRDDVADGVLPAQDDIGKVLACGHHLNQMISDLFEVVQSEDRDVFVESIDVQGLFNEIKTEFGSKASAKGLLIALDVKAGGERVTADKAMLTRCLRNLTSNALSFSTVGTVTLTSHRILGKANDLIQLQVMDKGQGIPENKIDAVFEPFVQVDNSKTRTHDGTGLGLYVTQSLVKKMAGSISLNSALGEGTTACITLAAT